MTVKEARAKAERAGVGFLSFVAGVSGPVWVSHRRFEYRPGARPLTDEESGALLGFFPSSVLENVMVAEVGCIKAPWVCRAAERLRLKRSLWPELLGGLALDDLIVVRQEGTKPAPLPVLFHELVHVLQYRLMGVRGFTREYIREWAKSGFDYLSLPMEKDAYELQERFVADPEAIFDVEDEVRRRLARHEESRRLERVAA